jgi:6-phospho-beta-glucosidase
MTCETAGVRLTMLGGGGFRTPLVFDALLRDRHERRVTEVVLHDTDDVRVASMRHVLDQMRSAAGDSGPSVRVEPDLDAALTGADFVFSALRVGGLSGRVSDERVALDLGLLGQETTGPGGIAYGLRTVPVAVRVAERVAAVAPNAWVINFTNPAGMITEAMQGVLGDRVIGICDSPLGLARRASATVGQPLDVTTLDYAGLNHLGWLRGIGGSDAFSTLLDDPARLESFEEGRLFGAEWLQDLGAIPNEYLYYFYFTRDALAAITGSAQTRGEFLLGQQSDFYAAVGAAPDQALALWRQARENRDATYMQESREQGEGRDADDIAGGGYEGVALALMAALARGERTALILNVRNGSALPELPADAVVEVPCTVDGAGVRPLPVTPLTGHPAGLVQQVKAVERLTIRAALEGSPRLARQAFALHPLVDSVTVADQLLAGYRTRLPELDAVFRAG